MIYLHELKNLLTKEIDREFVKDCLGALNHKSVVVQIGTNVSRTEDVYNIYNRRSQRSVGAIKGYTTTLLNLRSANSSTTRLHLICIPTDWFIVFTDAELTLLHGVLYERSESLYEYARRQEIELLKK